MEDIGNILKELRIKKGLTIEEIQEITKIRSRYIQAIEEGNLDRLPGQFYAKAFIKAYADVLKLDPAILAKYHEAHSEDLIEPVQIKPSYQAISRSPSRWGKLITTSLVYLLIALVLLFAYMFYVNNYSNQVEPPPGDPLGNERLGVDGTVNNSTDQTQQENTTEAGDSEEAQPKEAFNLQKVSTSTFSNRPLDTYEITVNEQTTISIQLKFRERCWIDIREGGANGKQLISTTFERGTETLVYELKDQIWIHLGFAAGVDIYLNDKLIKAGTEEGAKYISLQKK